MEAQQMEPGGWSTAELSISSRESSSRWVAPSRREVRQLVGELSAGALRQATNANRCHRLLRQVGMSTNGGLAVDVVLMSHA